MIIELTNIAKKELKDILEKRKDYRPIRIHMVPNCWGGLYFKLTLDEQKEGDLESTVNNFSFIFNETLTDEYWKLTIDYSKGWFSKGFTVVPDRIRTGW